MVPCGTSWSASERIRWRSLSITRGWFCVSCFSVSRKSTATAWFTGTSNVWSHSHSKAANLFLSADGNVKLSYFSTNKLFADTLNKSQSHILSLPYWMAPEVTFSAILTIRPSKPPRLTRRAISGLSGSPPTSWSPGPSPTRTCRRRRSFSRSSNPPPACRAPTIPQTSWTSCTAASRRTPHSGRQWRSSWITLSSGTPRNHSCSSSYSRKPEWRAERLRAKAAKPTTHTTVWWRRWGWMPAGPQWWKMTWTHRVCGLSEPSEK